MDESEPVILELKEGKFSNLEEDDSTNLNPFSEPEEVQVVEQGNEIQEDDVEEDESAKDNIEELNKLEEVQREDSIKNEDLNETFEHTHKVEESDEELQPSGSDDKVIDDNGFEHLKNEEVPQEENEHTSENTEGEEILHEENEHKENTEGEEVKRQLEDLVLQEELKLEALMDPVPDDPTEDFKELANTDAHIDNEGSKRKISNDEVEEVNHDVTEDPEDPAEHQPAEEIIMDESNQKICQEEQMTESRSQTTEDRGILHKCRDIVTWTHPLPSALIFSILMFVQLGLMCDHSIISLIAYSGLWLMVTSFLVRIAVSFRLINTQMSSNCLLEFDKEDVQYCVDLSVTWAEYLHKEITSIAYVDSYMKNIKVFTMLWILTYVGQMFNLQSLIFIGTLFLFSLPLVYLKFQPKIDQVVHSTHGQVSGVINKVRSRSQHVLG